MRVMTKVMTKFAVWGGGERVAACTVHRCAERARIATGDKNGDSNLAGLKSDIAGFAARASDTAIADT